MRGFGHLVWSAVGYNIFLSALTLILLNIQRTEFIIVSIGLSCLAVIIQMISARMQKKKTARKWYMLLRKVDLLVLSLSSIILMIFHLGLEYNGLPNFNGVFLFIGLYMSFFGAYLPDMDTKLLDHHRDPTTHSALLGSFVAFLLVFLVSNQYSPIILVFCGITVGIAMHLFCDIIPHGAMGWKALRSLIVWTESPGNIVGMKGKWEHPYLYINGLILMFFSVLLVLRSLTDFLAFPSIIEGGMDGLGTTGFVLFIISTLFLLLPSILQILWKD